MDLLPPVTLFVKNENVRPWFSPLNLLTPSITLSDMVDSSSYLCDKHPGIMGEAPELELDFKL